MRALVGEQLPSGVTWIETDRHEDQLPTSRQFETQRQIATLPALPEIPDESVDAVIGLSVLDAIPQSQLPAALAAMARVLRPGGKIIHILDLALSYEAEAEKVAGQSLIPWMYYSDIPDQPSARRIVYVDRIALTQVVNKAIRGQKISDRVIRTFR
ncbi:MAG: class I SAM-dependent methyltransferase, partial [Candidatus Omnitrophica bacterium]|nr:class I SAM-dependent methyltransferase [Candidatus Omnitrophota bacterium]